MSAALPEGVFHLLTADGDLVSPYRGLVAVCGEVVSTSALPPSCYPPPEGKTDDEPDRDALYCAECVLAAVRFSATTSAGASIQGRSARTVALVSAPRLFRAGDEQRRPISLVEVDGYPVISLRLGAVVTHDVIRELNDLIGTHYHEPRAALTSVDDSAPNAP